MTSPRITKAEGHAKTALAQMAKWQIAPEPQNYTVWFTYVAGTMPELSQAIDILLSNGQDVTATICEDLYTRYFSRSSTTIQSLMGNIEESVARAVGTLADAGRGAREYEVTLGHSAISLANESHTVRIREIVRQVLSETKTMIDRNDVLEQQLSTSTAEIGELRRQVADASREALTDPLTQIGNRKMFDLRLKQLMGQAMETGADLSLVLLDIDHFKAFNDNHGHQFGDLVLRLVASLLRDGITESDVAVRYGGEEFALLLPGVRLENAVKVAEMICGRIAKRSIVKRDTKVALGSVTLSAGVATYQFGEPPHIFVERVDRLLYKAKSDGRNCVRCELQNTSSPMNPAKYALRAT